MENRFNVEIARFQIDNRQTYLLQGWFDQNKIQQITFEANLDNTQCTVNVMEKSGVEIRKKYLRLNANIDYEYFVWITLPDQFSQFKTLIVYQKDNADNTRNKIWTISVPELMKKQRTPDYYLEAFSQASAHELLIRGWAVTLGAASISLMDDDHNPVEMHIKKTNRRDVIDNYPEREMDYEVGFEGTFALTDTKKLILCIEDQENGKKSVQTLSVRNALAGKGVKNTPSYLKKGIAYLRRNGIRKFLRRAGEKVLRRNEVEYKKWFEKHMPSDEELEKQKLKEFTWKPKFSIVVPLYKTPVAYLKEFTASVKNQTYSNWELCFSDGSGADSPLTKVLQDIVKEDDRIHLANSSGGKPLKIAENSNQAIEIASGDFIVFSDHDDLLAAHALFECAKALNGNNEIEALYSDEDKVSMDGKTYFEPHLKSDFNIDLLRSMNYICHLFVVKKEILQKAGKLKNEFDGAQDYDFVLRCCEITDQIYHIPKILYHWRAHLNSTAENPESKKYAFEAGKRAIEAHYKRIGIKADVEQGEYMGLYRTRYRMEELPLVSIIIPNKDHISDLHKCMDSIEQKSNYNNYEWIIIENNSTEDATFAFYKQIEAANPKVRVVYWEDEFNYSLINNYGAQYAKGDYLWFLNNDTEIINEDCLEEMLSVCMREDVGIVGSRLYYEDDTVQHAGVVIGFGGMAGHAFIGSQRGDNGYFSRIICMQDYSAVTAASMMVKKSVFDEAGGFCPELKIAFNDIDFCLKVRKLGKLVVYNPYAELYHYESKSRGQEDTAEKIERFHNETNIFVNKWRDIMENGDPYYNPNLTLDKADFSLKVL